MCSLSRRVLKSVRRPLSPLLLFWMAGGWGFADAPTWKLRSSITWLTGDYGTGVDSKLLYIPFTLQQNLPDGRWSVTVPYIWTENTADVTLFGGVPEGGSRGERFREAEGGLGDVVLRGNYYLAKPGKLADWAPGLDLTANLKFPTAEKDRGLGTGEFDFGLGMGLYQWVLPRIILFADLGYRFVGEPPGQQYDNQWITGAGLGYRASQLWIHSLYLEHRSAVTREGKEALSLLCAVTYAVHHDLEWVGGVEIGLSDGAPDHSLTLGFSYSFK